MSKKKIISTNGLVYSTDPDFKIDQPQADDTETLPAAAQKLRIRLDTKQRAGKSVTLIMDFTGRQYDREELGKKLKAYCGTGGAVKDGEIMVQGDNRDKILQWLQKNGYTGAKKI